MGPKRPQNRADSVLPCARNRGAEPFWPKSGVYKNARARAREGLGFLAYFSGAGNRSPNAACGPADRGSGATQRAPKLYWGGVLELISIFCLLDSAPNAISAAAGDQDYDPRRARHPGQASHKYLTVTA